MNPKELQRVGPYPVNRFIAEGGMAWVFEVVDTRFDARRALKMLKPQAAAGEEFRRFEAEARLLAQIDHPNLITIFDFGKDEGTGCYFYTMTYVDGPSLNTMGKLSLEEAGPIFLNVLSGLARLHAAGIVHRDIKPANVMLTEDRRALLGDLGIARAAEQSGGLTRTGTAIGTCLYMSPEQARGKPVGPQSDIFSMGLSIYEVLTGATVYDNVDDVDTTSGQEILLYLGSLIHTGGELAIHFPDDMPKAIRDVIQCACTFDPDKRYADAKEMHDALRTALQAPAIAPRKPLPVLPIAAALGGLAAVGAAAWFVQGSVESSVAGESRDTIAELEQSATRVVDSVAALEPAPPPLLVSDARRELEVAATFFQRGQESLANDAVAAANTSLELAEQSYERACDQVVTQYLKGRSDTAAAQADERAAGLREVSASTLTPERWQQLEGLLAGLSGPIEGDSICAQGEAHLARITQSSQATALAVAIEQDVSTEWPKLVAFAETGADDAKTAADAVAIDAQEFELVYARGVEELAAGRVAVESESYLQAQESFRGAQESFREAEAIGPAARGRAEVTRLEREAINRGIVDFGIVSRIVSEAESLYRAGQWDEAAKSYAQGAKLFGNLFEDAQRSAQASLAAGKADTLRSSAVDIGAERVAKLELERGDALRDEGTTLLEGQRYDEAETRFAAAGTQYASARDAGRVALSDAKAMGDKARLARKQLGSCGALLPAAQAQCNDAGDVLRSGDQALEQRDAVTAQARFVSAESGFKRAAERQDASLRKLPKPPAMVSRSPVGNTVKIYRNESAPFKIEATDPNGDSLHYSWTVDGKPVRGNGARLEITPTQNVRVAVKVDDGTGQSFEQGWRVQVVNRKPKLSVSPKTPAIQLEVGKRQAFTARSNDPDGDSVRIEYRLGEKRVATGSSYTFVAEKPGRYTVFVKATDGAGGDVTFKRTITVVEKPAPRTLVKKTPPSVKQTPAAVEPAVTKPTQLASVPDPTIGARQGLAEYKAAWEARDVNRLSKVRKLSSAQRRSMEAYFKSTGSIRLSVDEKRVYGVTPERVTIDFDQTVSAKGSKPTRTPYTARMEKRADRWVIAELNVRK